jgi:hypothetical protein
MTIHKTASVAPEHQRSIVLQELFGAARDDDTSYFPPHLVDQFIHTRHPPPAAPEVIYIAIDPASHWKSYMGLAAIVCAAHRVCVIGTAGVAAKRCAIVEVQVAVAAFITEIKKLVGKVVPIGFIIECNTSSVYACSILATARKAAAPFPVLNPFTSDFFHAEITPGVGPWTTSINKHAAVEATLNAMLDRSLAISTNCITIGRSAYNSHAAAPTPAAAIESLGRELKRIRDDGVRINGKAGGQDDDMAMALFLAVYW